MFSARFLLADITTCLGFYTRLPVPPGETPRSFARAQWAAPVAGCLVGLIGGLACWLAAWLGLPAGIAAAIALAATMLATGCLHEDGLADVADGFGGGTTRERKLEIMRDSRIGTYGAAALSLGIIARWSAIAALAPSGLVLPALLAAHAGSRALLPAFMHMVPPARNDGLSAGLSDIPPLTIIIALAIGGAVLLPGLGFIASLYAVAALALWFVALKILCERQIGGQTGDVLGTLQQGGEIIVLAAACATFT